MKNVICPSCGKDIEVWTYSNNREFQAKEVYFGGICKRCLLNVEVKSLPMTDEEIREAARD